MSRRTSPPATPRSPSHPLAVLALAALAAMGLSGCAAAPRNRPDPRDPFERVNRSIYRFNDALDRAVLRPVAQGYVHYVPSPVRRGARNFMTNLTYSDVLVNDLLQGQLHDGANDAARLVVNTLFGIGGLFDPASPMGLDRNDRDFGQTFGKWGIPSGPFLELPFLGPSDVRDGIGLIPDEYATPRAYIASPYARWSLWVVDKVDKRAQLLPEDAIIRSAYDPYAFVRNAYLQHRDYLVHGDQASDDAGPPPDLTDPASAPR